MSISDIPDDILTVFVSYCVDEGIETLLNTRIVDTRLRRICDRYKVLKRLSVDQVPFHPWGVNEQSFNKFYKRLVEVENMEAIYIIGIRNYFEYNRHEEGIRLLSQASAMGFTDAKYIYGIILVCLGGNLKANGYDMLISLFLPSISQTLERFYGLQRQLMSLPTNVRWCGYQQLKDMKRSYEKHVCLQDKVHGFPKPEYIMRIFSCSSSHACLCMSPSN